MFKIGVMTDSFRIDTKSAIKKAAELGAAGLQMYATKFLLLIHLEVRDLNLVQHLILNKLLHQSVSG